MEQSTWGRSSSQNLLGSLSLWQDWMYFRHAAMAPATPPLSPRHTPTAPYASEWTRTDRKTMRRKKRKRRTWSLLEITVAEDTTVPDSNTHRCTSCSTAARSRPRPPARGISTSQSRAPWSTAGDRHPRTTSHQAGPVLGALRRDPSLQTATLTRR